MKCEKDTATVYVPLPTTVRNRYIHAYRLYGATTTSRAVDIRCSASEPTTVRVEWTEADGARAYRLERRLVSSPDNAEGEKEFSVIKPSTTDKSYSDTNVKELSTYAYRVTVLSNAETSPVSDVAEVRTPSLSSAPEGVFNLFAASGNKKVTLVWDKTYRTTWDIERSESETGPWQTVATGVSATSWSDKNVENGSTYYYRLTPRQIRQER